MNDITRSFGFIFRDDLLFGTFGSAYDDHYDAAPTPHPAVQHVPWFDFAVSCSIEPGWSWGRAAILATGLWNMPPDYHMSNYHPVPQHCPEMRCGAFIQAWATRCGKGRVIAFTDSTIFSNFCLFQPGKINLMLDMVEWLNHGNAWIDPAPWLGLLGLIVLAAGGGIARRRSTAWFLLLAGALCGWSVGELAAGAMQRRAVPLPPVLRPQSCVVIDRTASRVLLAQGAFNEDKQGLGFGLFEQWIPRLGYYTVRADGAAATAGDALVVICPDRGADPAFCRAVGAIRGRRRQALGDRLAGQRRLDRRHLAAPVRPLLSPRADPGRCAGVGRFLAGICRSIRLGKSPAGSRSPGSVSGPSPPMVRCGKGLVMAMGFGSSWNDAALGNDWGAIPDGVTLVRYDALFAMLRLLVENKSIACAGARQGRGPLEAAIPGQAPERAGRTPSRRPPVRQR